MLSRWLSLTLPLAAGLMACGDNTDPKATPDSRPRPIDGAPPIDGTPPIDAVTEVPAACVDVSFPCMGAFPTCNPETMMCVAAPGACTGDDAAEPNDGPSQATAVGTSFTGSICSAPTFAAGQNRFSLEADWYRVPLDGLHRFTVTWTHAPELDLDVYVYDMAGARVAVGVSVEEGRETFTNTQPLPAGNYYLHVDQFGPIDATAAIAYSVEITVPECQTNFDCIGQAGEPVCSPDSTCVAGPNQCVGDDAGDMGGGDDGPGGARPLTSGVAINAGLCNTPASEVDYYSVTVTAGQGVQVSATFADGQDFDLVVFNSQGTLMGQGFWQSPEVVTLTYLPAGTYYIATTVFSGTGITSVIPYSITATVTPAQVCTSRADCGAEAVTQLYRGDCVAGVCQPIAPAAPLANGMPCDSRGDCMSDFCSYLLFDTDPAESVCSTMCTTDADCAAVGPGLVCSTGFTTNFCLPACANNSECGALRASDTPTPGDPWAYFVCDTDVGSCGPRPPEPPSVAR